MKKEYDWIDYFCYIITLIMMLIIGSFIGLITGIGTFAIYKVVWIITHIK